MFGPSIAEIVLATPFRFALSAFLIIMSLRDIFGGATGWELT